MRLSFDKDAFLGGFSRIALWLGAHLSEVATIETEKTIRGIETLELAAVCDDRSEDCLDISRGI